MKLSESILLGSTVVTPKAGALRFSGENAGCALGMALIANGCTFSSSRSQFPAKDQRTLNVEDIWGRWLLRVVIRPCECPAPVKLTRLRLKEIPAYLFACWSGTRPREMRIKDIIAHLFDHQVMGKKNWTLERLVAWVERWEPSARSTPIADLARIPHSPRHSHQLSDDAAEWQKTREAFEAKVTAKRRRGPSRS